MNLLAFYLGLHDSNVAIYNKQTKKVEYIKSERVFHEKHHKADLKFIKDFCKSKNFTPDAVAFSDGNRNNLGICKIGELYKQTKPIKDLYDVPTFCLAHHYAHILSCWPVTALEDVDIGVSLDGKGDNNISKTAVSKPAQLREFKILDQSEGSFGDVLNYIGHYLMGLSGKWIDLAGKIMGAQAYGEVDFNYLQALDLKEVVRDPFILINEIKWKGKNIKLYPKKYFKFENKDFRDWLTTIHKVIEKSIILYISQHCDKDQKIVYAGGVAQNTIANDILFKMFPKLHIPPHCYDGGLSLGCLEFLRLYYNIEKFDNDGFPYWQQDYEKETPTIETIRKCARLLTEDKILGWFQRGGEIGPRALGHRSILMNPCVKNGKEIINNRIKHREHWRPYAPSVLESEAKKWFEINKPSPYMLRAVMVKEGKQSIIPSVIHKDRTSRIHTVKEDNSCPYYLLLKEFDRLTGIPMVLNTSFNFGGKPIVSTREECLEFFHTTPLDALCIGNDLYVKGKFKIHKLPGIKFLWKIPRLRSILEKKMVIYKDQT